MQQLPATLDMDENFKRMKYVRYADDFLICVIGSKADCQKAKEDIKNFLQEQLKLQLSSHCPQYKQNEKGLQRDSDSLS